MPHNIVAYGTVTHEEAEKMRRFFEKTFKDSFEIAYEGNQTIFHNNEGK